MKVTLRGDDITRHADNIVTPRKIFFSGPRWWQGLKRLGQHLDPEFRHIPTGKKREYLDVFLRKKLFSLKRMTILPDLMVHHSYKSSLLKLHSLAGSF
jgi:hypothetical protein